MNNKEINKNIEVLEREYNEIETLWKAIQGATKVNDSFWCDVSFLRQKIKRFYDAFGALTKDEKVKHWDKITSANLINVIIE